MWSLFCFRYFTALTNGDPLPVKKRLEAGGLGFSIGLLEILYHQIPGNQRVTIVEITKKWDDLGLPADVLHEIIVAGGFAQELEFSKFFAVAASHLGGGVSVGIFAIVCHVVSHQGISVQYHTLSVSSLILRTPQHWLILYPHNYSSVFWIWCLFWLSKNIQNNPYI